MAMASSLLPGNPNKIDSCIYIPFLSYIKTSRGFPPFLAQLFPKNLLLLQSMRK